MSNLPIPAEALEDAGIVLGRRGSGKSNSLMVLWEHELDAGHRSVMIDPKGDRWGIRMDPSGKAARFKIPVFGGTHGDRPVTEDMGERLGALVAEHDLSCLIDLSQLSLGGKQRFMMGFAPTLLERNRAPLTLFLEEVDQFANQDPRYQPPMLVHHIANFATLGRQRGIVPWFASQRPAKVNATLRSQADTFVGMKVISPLDRDAYTDWFKGYGKEAAARVEAEIGKLGKGEALVWVSETGFFERVQFPMASTYDSGRTPKHGETIDAIVLPKLDNAQILELLAGEDTPIADTPAPKAAKAAPGPDPRDARIAELEAAAIEARAELTRRTSALGTIAGQRDVYQDAFTRISDIMERVRLDVPLDEPEKSCRHPQGVTFPAKRAAKDPAPPAKADLPTPAPSAIEEPDHSTLPPAQQRILDQIAWACEAFHKSAVDRQVLAIVLGVHPRTKGFLNNLGSLRSAGLIDYPDGKGVALTATGFALAAVPNLAGATLKQLRDHVCKWLPAGQARILRLAIDAFPNAISRDRLAELLNTHPRTKSLLNNLGRLRTLGLLVGSPALPCAAGYLFGKD